jgi:hypothetical protein
LGAKLTASWALACASLWAQATCGQSEPCLTFMPQAKTRSIVPWSVTLCTPPPETYELPIGRIYEIMVDNKIAPLTYGGAVAVLSGKQRHSVAARIATYAGYAAAGAATVLTLRSIQANIKVDQAVFDGSTFLNVLIPFAIKQEPSFATLIAEIARDSDILKPPVGSCAGTVIIGPPGAAFNVPVKPQPPMNGPCNAPLR